MLRLGVVLLCSIAVPGAVFAFPKAAIPGQPFPIVRVEDESGFAGVDEPMCSSYLPHEMPAECTAYFRKLREKQAAAAARLKAERAQKAGAQQAKQAAKKAPAAGRHARAPKPLVPDAAALPAKAPPGNTPEERLRFMVGQLVLTGFSGREPADGDVERVARGLRAGRLSGVILRDSNVAGPSQLRALIEAISSGGDYPALMAIEQPGGADTVLAEDKGFAFYASANAVSSSGTPYDAQLSYRAMASRAGLG